MSDGALGGQAGSELGPLHFGHVGRIAGTLVNEEERIAVAKAGLERAEGHGHGQAKTYVQDAEVLRLGAKRTKTKTSHDSSQNPLCLLDITSFGSWMEGN